MSSAIEPNELTFSFLEVIILFKIQLFSLNPVDLFILNV